MYSYLYPPSEKISRLKVGDLLALQSGKEPSDPLDNQTAPPFTLDDLHNTQKVLVELEAHLTELSTYENSSAPKDLFNNIMDCFVQLKDYSKVKYYYQKMKDNNITPNETTLNLLLQSLTPNKTTNNETDSANNTEEQSSQDDNSLILEVLQIMTKYKDIKFTSTQSTIPVLQYFAQQNDMKTLQVYFQRMLDQGVRPDTQALNLLIQVSTVRGTSSSNFFSFMKSTNIPRDINTYFHLIKGAQTREEVEYYFEQLLKDKTLNSSSEQVSLEKFNLILEALSQHNEVGLMLHLRILMKWKEFPPHIHTALPFVKTLAERNQVKPMMSILNALETADSDVPRDMPYIAVMSALAQKGDLQNLTKQFDAMKAYHDIPCSYYCSMIEKLGQLLQIKQAIRYFNEAKNKFGIQSELCDAIMTALNSCSLHKNAIGLFSRLLYYGIRPSSQSFMLAIQACIQARNPQLAVTYFNLLTSEELMQLPSIATSLIKSLSVYPEQVPSMIAILERMQHEGITADIVTYNALIYCFGNKGDIANMINIYELLQKEKIQPNTKTYNILITCFARNKKISEAIQYLNQMVETGQKPSAKTFAALMRYAARAGQITLMLKFYRISESIKVRPHTEIYEVLITTFARLGTLGAMRKYIRLMKMHNLGLTQTMINAYLSALAKNGDVDTAYRLYSEHRQRLAFSTRTYEILIPLFGYRNEYPKMMEMYNNMKQEGINPSMKIYYALMKAHLLHDENSATQFADQLTREGISQTILKQIRWMLKKLKSRPIPITTKRKRPVRESEIN